MYLLPSESLNTRVEAAIGNKVIRQRLAQLHNGGDYGDPLPREPERVLRDVLNGAVSIAAAERFYGVAIDDGNIKDEATSRLRESIRNDRLSKMEPPRENRDGEKIRSIELPVDTWGPSLRFEKLRRDEEC